MLYQQQEKTDGQVAMSQPSGSSVLENGRARSITETETSYEDASEIESGYSTPIKSQILKERTFCSDLTNVPVGAATVPEKRLPKLVRNLRYISFNLYRRLFALIFMANMVPLIVLLVKTNSIDAIPLSSIATASSANILVAVAIRQDYMVNALFSTCFGLARPMPFWIRRLIAKSYEYGGIHSGTAVAGTLWFILLTALITRKFATDSLNSIPVVVFAYIMLLLFLSIVIFAYPTFRARSHNTFENFHRYSGWSAVALFWVELVLLTDALPGKSNKLGLKLVGEPSFWLLILITLNIIWPWARLRHIEVTPEKLSDHALRLHFSKTLIPFSGYSIANHPLGEWHPFAPFPDEDGERSSLVVSDAGDWTKQTVANPQNRYWVRGEPKYGVLSLTRIFKSCVVVTTGSGIGPCLAFTANPWCNIKCRLLWSTPSPLETYGEGICQIVDRIDPRALIIDTRKAGRPDLVDLAYRLYVESNAECVFVISNQKLTKKVVYAMESRGVPAFGPIWDS